MEFKDEDRGKIHIRDRAQQIRDFSGLRYGKVTPTDIDACLEMRQYNAIILYEFKSYDVPMPRGQRIALEEMIDCFEKAGKSAILFKCVHGVSDAQKDIVADQVPVVAQYQNKKWTRIHGHVTCRQITDAFLEFAQNRMKEHEAE